MSFKNQYFQMADEKLAASTFCDLLKEPIQQSIKNTLAAAVLQDMKRLPWVRTKYSLKATILISLGDILTGPPNSTYENINYYFHYLRNPADSLKFWIRYYTDKHCAEQDEDGLSRLASLASQKAYELVAVVQRAVKVIEERIISSDQEIDPSKWLIEVCRKLTQSDTLGNVVNVFERFQDLGISRSLKDIRYFTEEVKQRLEILQKELRQELQYLTIQDLDKKPYDLLYSQLCGCEAQCPFCNEQCDATIKDHVESGIKHICEHRPRCLAEFKRSRTQELIPDVCNSLVGSIQTFHSKETDDKPWPFKEYSRIYPDWSIIVDMGAKSSLYWKWFVGNYSKEIAKHFGAKDGGIPSEWRRLTWEQAKQDVKDTYHV